jgi:hypothetical protein
MNIGIVEGDQAVPNQEGTGLSTGETPACVVLSSRSLPVIY